MQKISFHNRDFVFQEYMAKKGHNRCIYCQHQYHPEYTRAENTFVWAGCDYHLAHRKCILNVCGRYQKVDLQKMRCPLCMQVQMFSRRHERGQGRQENKIIEMIMEEQHDQIEQILKAVQRKGFYKYK